MHPALRLLDQAIELGNLELAHLSAGDVEKAEEVAFGRDHVLNAALSDESLAASREGEGECLDDMVNKLEELKLLQTKIIDVATRLRTTIGQDISRMGMEERRHRGYGRATRPTPRIRSAFISTNS